MIYDVDYFLKKFEAIPDDLWLIGTFQRTDEAGVIRRCALGHCGGDGDGKYPEMTNEYIALKRIFTYADFLGKAFYVTTINDGNDPRFQQPTPKARVLAALNHIKEQTYVLAALNHIKEQTHV